MHAKTLTPLNEEKALQWLTERSRSKRQEACLLLAGYILTPRVEAVLREVAASDGIAGIRRAARKATLNHWRRSRGQGLKSDADHIKGHLAAHGVTVLYHLTAKANFASIQATGGLLSRASLNKRGLEVAYIADCNRDKVCGTDEWIHLCFHPNQPMFHERIPKKRRHEFIVLDVSIEVALWESTVFSDENSIASRAQLGPDFPDLQKLDLVCFTHGMFSAKTKSAWQAEVLIHPIIPVTSIIRTRSYSEVLEMHRSSVPMGAKLEYLDKQAGILDT